MDDDLLINIDLDSVDDGTDPVPAGAQICTVHTVQRKQGKEFPYFEVVLKPDISPSKSLWLNLSTHPKALWNLKLFAKALGLPMKGLNLADALGQKVGVTVAIVKSNRDPNRDVNEVSPPYTSAR